MNKVILMGNLGRDPELKKFESGSQLVNFSMATTDHRKDKEGNKVEDTTWHEVTFWGVVADIIHKYFKKGDKILIEGSIKTREYEVDGQKRRATDIVGRDFHFVGGGNKQESNHKNTIENSKAPLPPPIKLGHPEPTSPIPMVSDDLPF